jgi:D-alanine-D-alanine ligase
MSRADAPVALEEAWRQAAGYACVVFAEEWIEGAEYTAAILAEQSLPLIRLETPNTFYDFDAKYRADTTRYHCPCGLSDAEEQTIQRLALRACRVLGVRGWGRVDLLVDRSGRPTLIEVNTVPGMTDHSLVPMAAKAAGIDFDELVWRILETSLRQA